MSRRLRALAALLPVLLACNDYQFSPVGTCVIQPGSVRVSLPKTSSADILFVVDDSPSMDPKQAALAASFQDFIRRMVDTNVARAGRGLQPIDFQIAVTTSSIFTATPAATACAAGNSCCATSACTDVAACTRGTSQGCGAGQLCVTDQVLDPTFTFVAGIQPRCCAISACTPSAGCSPGDRCPVFQTTYPSPLPTSQCTPGLATAGAPYPAGRFVSAGSNPKVLSFPKALDWASWNTATPDPRLVQLLGQFQQNIRVGSCGAGEEQHLEAARRALLLAFGGGQPAGGATFPRSDAKLIVVWVGDEDDCSTSASAPLVVSAFSPGADSCVLDKHLPASSQREFAVSAYASFLSLLRQIGKVADVAAAFIVSAARCTDGSYAPADVCSGPATCPVTPPASCAPPAGVCGGAYAAGERFLALADQLRNAGIGVVEGSVCEAFGPVLAAIADLAKPPSMLQLPTLPAARTMTSVRIVDGTGGNLKTCQAGTDWCFVDCAAPNGSCLATGTSQCIAINHTSGQCEADPGQTYSADYLGLVPPNGCLTSAECASALGGREIAWACVIEQGMSRGTCSCTGK
ncbi:MAG TPA: hypothetical protein VF912_01355 [Anaeromyxobacter sp.]